LAETPATAVALRTMRLGLRTSALVILATAVAITGARASTIQASGASGSWSRAAGLITGREKHTATLLPDGSVLIAGGSDGRGKALASAEVYNPATNRWTSVGSMVTARLDHTATLLPSGKVLVAGGQVGPDPFGSLASAELYDPTTGVWSAAAPMIVSRARHTATLLGDGRVLVVGGLSLVVGAGGLFPSPPTDAEIYDPTADRWSTTAPMECYRFDATATVLADGRVLVAGGQCGGATLNSTEIYDATADRWIIAAAMGARRSGHAAAPLPDGDVLVLGGTGEEPNSLAISLTSAEIYNPSTNLWVTVASMAAVHVKHSATTLGNGKVLTVGFSGRSRPEVYDMANNTWANTGPLMDRYHHTATRLRSGKVLIVGGFALESLDSVLLYDPDGLAPGPPQPVDPRVTAAVGLTALLIIVGIGLSIPAVRRRLNRWRPPEKPDEWVT
jgi:hypothetical protein